MRNTYRLMTMTVTVTLSMGVMAQSLSLLREVQRLSLPIEVSQKAAFTANPGTMVYRDSISLSSLAVTGDLRHEDKPVVEQKGDGYNLAGFAAGSYTRLDSMSAVWGEADFTTGSYRSIRWNDCIDYDRVAPYILGDEVGGDLSTRRYRFSGGYGRSFGRWSAGVEAAYRAEIAYRNHDPRVKTVVSDLDVNLGGAYGINDHCLGLSAGINVYDQSCDLDFYNPINEINTYTLTGMGTYYRRFMGNTNKNSGYSSFGYTVGLQWLPVRNNVGLAADVKYTAYRMEQQLRNFNNLTLGYTDNDIIGADIAYRIRFSDRLTFRPMVNAGLRTRKGTENMFGTSAGASYDKIGSRTPYKLTDINLGLALPLQLQRGQSFVTLSPGVAYTHSEESYTEPYRKLAAGHLIPGLQADFSTISSGRYLIEASVGGSYAIAEAETPVLTDLDPSTALGQCVLSNFSMLRADRGSLNVSAGVSRHVNSFVLSLSVAYMLTDYVGEGICHGASVTLAAKF
ncbi:MAG: hypothetical protein NC212_01640 [Staphylococcus sp.]|nr:hypothetical protein [Staphylococcus sp.]